MGQTLQRHLDLYLFVHTQGKALQELFVARLEAEAADARFQSAVAAMHEGLIVVERGQGIVLCNPCAEALLGVKEKDLLGKSLSDPCWTLFRDDNTPFPRHAHPLTQALEQGTPHQKVTLGVQRPDGEFLWLSVNATPLFHSGESTPYAAVGTLADISDQRHFEKIAEQQLIEFNKLNRQLELRQRELAQANLLLEAQATIDGLTGLKNHRKFQEELLAQYRMSARYQHPLSLILLDVDYFKQYNDTYGHPAGDEVLRTIAEALLSATRVTDCAARYGGEEFAIILPHTSAEDSKIVAERCRRVIAEIPWPRRSVTVSVGIATLRLGTDDPKELIIEADEALYYSKGQGRNRITHGLDLRPELQPQAT